ncbi:MAG: hypothetical protein ACJAYU_005350 [Bradymonadia bacterium]|jgi:hypothetical protein
MKTSLHKSHLRLRAAALILLSLGGLIGASPWDECVFAFPPDGIRDLARELDRASSDCVYEGISADRDVAQVGWSVTTGGALSVTVHPLGCGPDGSVPVGSVELSGSDDFRVRCPASFAQIAAPEFATNLGVVTVQIGGDEGGPLDAVEASSANTPPRVRRDPAAGVGTIAPDFAPFPMAWRMGFWPLALAGWCFFRIRRR